LITLAIFPPPGIFDIDANLTQKIISFLKYQRFQVFVIYPLLAHNPKAVGSNPAPATKKTKGLANTG
jgi:hypothetical protein